jgi:hypothetical protein
MTQAQRLQCFLSLQLVHALAVANRGQGWQRDEQCSHPAQVKRMDSPHVAKQLAVVDRAMLEDDAPATEIFFAEDSGFFLVSDEAPHADDATPEDFRAVCLGCLLEIHPEAARGMDLAKQHGEEWLEDGSWVAA